METQEKTFVKYPKIPHLGESLDILNNPVRVYEKLDGGNAQIKKEGYRVFAGNRSHFLNDRRDKSLWFLEFNKWVQRNLSFMNLPEDFVLYGEWISLRSNLNFPYEQSTRNRFFFLDLFSVLDNTFVDYKDAVEIVSDWNIRGLDFLRCLKSGEISYEELTELCKKSDYRDGTAEGVVVKDYDKQKFAKLLTKHALNQPLDCRDVRRAITVLIERDEKPTLEKVVQELMDDFKGYPKDEVRRIVNDYSNIRTR